MLYIAKYRTSNSPVHYGAEPANSGGMGISVPNYRRETKRGGRTTKKAPRTRSREAHLVENRVYLRRVIFMVLEKEPLLTV